MAHLGLILLFICTGSSLAFHVRLGHLGHGIHDTVRHIGHDVHNAGKHIGHEVHNAAKHVGHEVHNAAKHIGHEIHNAERHLVKVLRTSFIKKVTTDVIKAAVKAIHLQKLGEVLLKGVKLISKGLCKVMSIKGLDNLLEMGLSIAMPIGSSVLYGIPMKLAHLLIESDCGYNSTTLSLLLRLSNI